TTLPQTITQHDHWRAAGFVFVVGEDASVQRVDAQHTKHVRGHLHGNDPFGVTGAGEVVAAAVVDTDLFKRLIVVAPIRDVRIGDRHLVDHGARLVQKHELLGFVVRQRPQQDRVDYTEDGAVGADAEGEGKDHDR